MDSPPTFQIRSAAVFGDAMDIFAEGVGIKSGGGTIIFEMNTKRDFLSGHYAVNLIPMKDWNNDKRPIVIICHESVDANKIAEKIYYSNIGSDFRNKNFVNRYDWFHFANFSSTDLYEFEEKGKSLREELQKQLGDDYSSQFFFVDFDQMHLLQEAKFKLKEYDDYLKLILSLSDDSIIGVLINPYTKNSPPIIDEYHYGAVLVDKESEKSFALVYGNVFIYRELEKNQEMFDINGVNYTFDMKEFA